MAHCKKHLLPPALELQTKPVLKKTARWLSAFAELEDAASGIENESISINVN